MNIHNNKNNPICKVVKGQKTLVSHTRTDWRRTRNKSLTQQESLKISQCTTNYNHFYHRRHAQRAGTVRGAQSERCLSGMH